MSTVTSPATRTPKRAASRAIHAARALATRVFVGVHPSFTHVPPSARLSIRATFRPARASRAASEGPACPAPMTIASSFGIAPSPAHASTAGAPDECSGRAWRPGGRGAARRDSRPAAPFRASLFPLPGMVAVISRPRSSFHRLEDARGISPFEAANRRCAGRPAHRPAVDGETSVPSTIARFSRAIVPGLAGRISREDCTAVPCLSPRATAPFDRRAGRLHAADVGGPTGVVCPRRGGRRPQALLSRGAGARWGTERTTVIRDVYGGGGRDAGPGPRSHGVHLHHHRAAGEPRRRGETPPGHRGGERRSDQATDDRRVARGTAS